MTRVPINKKLLSWARERAGLEQDALIGRFKKLPEWEAGKVQPTLKQAEAFARAVHVPIGFLFLTEPPEESLPIPDFRTFAGQPMLRPSPNPFGYHLCLPGAAELVSRFRTHHPDTETRIRWQRHG